MFGWSSKRFLLSHFCTTWKLAPPELAQGESKSALCTNDTNSLYTLFYNFMIETYLASQLDEINQRGELMCLRAHS